MSAERWLPTVGFDGYEVSDLGRVRSWLPYRGSELPRLMRTHLDTNGYVSLRLWDGSRQVHVRVHRLVMEAFAGPLPAGRVTRHLSGDKSDNRLENLSYGSFVENAQDAVEHGHNGRSSRTRCPAQHEYTPENTRHATRGNGKSFRICKTCERARDARRRAERVA